jgi:glycosyltransferase involved in cell wall biosynthesis
MIFFSIVIPVYNRPDELNELLDSLSRQTYTNFEVLVIEDGSTRKATEVADRYKKALNLRYIYKENTGQGFSRNFGFERANGDYFIVFDSDAIVPPAYLATVAKSLSEHWLDAYGGPDAADPNFTALQKAISYSMTSTFTTGGIRGSKKNLGGQFHPRSFNMGLSRKVFTETGGFAKRDMGEDMELSTRLIRQGYKVGLIPDAFVYHKRRGTFGAFFRQVISFGRTRVQLKRLYGIPIKLVHTLPVWFTLSFLILPIVGLLNVWLFGAGVVGLGILALLIFIDSSVQAKSVEVGYLSVIAAFIQLCGYGLGFLKEIFSPKSKK